MATPLWRYGLLILARSPSELEKPLDQHLLDGLWYREGVSIAHSKTVEFSHQAGSNPHAYLEGFHQKVEECFDENQGFSL